MADGTGDEERVLSAAVAFGSVSLWGSRAWGQTDQHLVGVLQRQLARLDGTEDHRTVRLLSTLASELYFDEYADPGMAYAERALELGRRVGDPSALGIAISGYLYLHHGQRPTRPEAGDDRGVPRSPGAADFGPDVEAVLRFNLLTERLRYGELARFDAELGRCRELATDVLHSPELEGQLFLCGSVPGGLRRRRAIAVRQWAERGLDLLQSTSATWSEPSRLVLESTFHLVSHSLEQRRPRASRTGPCILTTFRFRTSPSRRPPSAMRRTAT